MRVGVGIVVLAAVAAAWGGPARAADTPSPVCKARSAPIPRGPATFVSQTTVAGSGGRMRNVVLRSPALGGQTTHVNVLLPKGYDPSGRTRYRVLYLLHGASGSYEAWHVNGDIASLLGDAPYIAVMPDAGTWGFYADWYGTDLHGMPADPPPAWTTYHIRELIPWVDRTYPTRAGRTGRAVAGLSMGGFGAASYAARFPDLFAAAASFSGAVNPDLDYPNGNAWLTAASAGFDGGKAHNCVWGDMLTQQVHWEGDDPTYLAGNLASTSLYVASGGGDAADPAGLFVSDPIEESCFLMSRAFVAALDADRIPHTDDFYGAGTHTWPFWQNDLRRWLPKLAAAWGRLPAAPPARAFSYRSIAPSFSVWGWSFTAHRESTEFTYLDDVSRTGLKVAGSGRLGVVSAPLYVAGARYVVRQGGRAAPVVADGRGRLRFTVDLGPAHASQQQDFPAAGAPDGWARAVVGIARG